MSGKDRQVSLLMLLLFWVSSLVSPIIVDAKTYMYLFDPNGNVLKLDTDADTIVGRHVLQNINLSPSREGMWQAIASSTDNILFVISGGPDFRIAAFDLRTLAFKKDLGIVSSGSPRVFIPPKVPHFFVLWFDPAAGEAAPGVMSRFEKSSLTRLADLPQYPILGDRNAFSPDGTRLYSAKTGDSSTLRIFDSQNLQLLSTLNVPPLLAPSRWGGGIADIQGDRMLLVENVKTRDADPNRYNLFTVNLTDQSHSPRIPTGLEGEPRLTPLGNKIVFEETAPVFLPSGTLLGSQSVGRLHVYDVATGTKLGQLAIPLRGAGSLTGIRPQGDKAYFLSGVAPDNDQALASVSLANFALLKEVTVPPVVFMALFEDP